MRDHHCSPSCTSGVCSNADIDATICWEGFYCPTGSTSPNQLECGGSGLPLFVLSLIFEQNFFVQRAPTRRAQSTSVIIRLVEIFPHRGLLRNCVPCMSLLPLPTFDS